MQDVIRLCRLHFFKKTIICAARLLDRLEYNHLSLMTYKELPNVGHFGSLETILEVSYQSDVSDKGLLFKLLN